MPPEDHGPEPVREGTGPPPVRIEAPIEAVYETLLDASLYPRWLVGAVRIRSVDANWPAVGASFHHVIGGGPLRIPGSTTIAELHEPERLLLSAGMGVLGRAMVRFELSPAPADADRGDGGGATLVHMTEVAAEGPIRLAWVVLRPLAVTALFGRNALSLARFRDLMEAGAPRSGRTDGGRSSDGGGG